MTALEPAPATANPKPLRRLRAIRELLLIVLLALTLGALILRVEGFRSTRVLTLLLSHDWIDVGLLSVAMTFVILTAGIDLSVGSTFALSAMAFGLAWERSGGKIGIALLAALGTGAAAGAFNGVLIAGARIPALIVTLATLSVYRGLAAGLGGGASISGFAPGFVELGQRQFLGLPLPAWLMAAFFVAGGIYLARTKGGRAIYALGANEGASRLAGVPARLVRFRIYTLSGLLAGLGAVIYAALNDTVKADVGRDYELRAITVAVLGGTSVAGGEGTLLGTAIALALLDVGLNGMDLAGIPRERQSMVVAAVLILSLWIDSRVRARMARAH
jgi:rhamnose transport system permease protein